MSYWFWVFLFFSFLGYLLERCFAKLTAAEKQNRKCFLLLPLCPVYGLGMLALLQLPADWTDGFWQLAFWGGLTATAVEFAVHWFYETFFGVRFWDYSSTKMDIDGRISLPFSVAWGLLSAMAVRVVLPVWQRIYAVIPPYLTLLMALLLLADCACSAHVLWTFHDTERLNLRALRRENFR